MRRVRAIFIALVLALAIAPTASADSITGRGAPPESAGASLPFANGFMMRLAAAQKRLNDTISAEFRSVRDGGSRLAILAILGLSFLYGALHAVGPGHGKAVVASYFVANRARWTAGIVMGSMISLIQGVSAIAMVGLLAILLQWRQFEVLNRTASVEFVSYALIALLGAVMLFRAVTGRGHHHHGLGEHAHHEHHEHHEHEHAHDHAAARPRPHRLDLKLVIAAGLTPCASAIIILLFALANDALGVGIAAVAVLSLGMALTVSTIGVASVLGRHTLLRVLDAVGVKSHRFEQSLAAVGAFCIVAVSTLLMLGAWYRI
jgi:ABC-type nickel/cobalt efflux system permease component RcnA